jgi:DNA invertase Pin-like site-specific DNA recombinase
LFLTITAALATFESDITKERVLKGMEVARERHGGGLPVRGPGPGHDRQAVEGQEAAGHHRNEQDRRGQGRRLSRATLYRYLAE